MPASDSDLRALNRERGNTSFRAEMHFSCLQVVGSISSGSTTSHQVAKVSSVGIRSVPWEGSREVDATGKDSKHDWMCSGRQVRTLPKSRAEAVKQATNPSLIKAAECWR